MADIAGSRSPPRTIDASMYPHLIDQVLRDAPYSVLLAFRRTSSRWRSKVDCLLVEHILVFSDYRIASRRGPFGRLPFDTDDFAWTTNPALRAAVRVVDIQSGRIPSIEKLTASEEDGERLHNLLLGELDCTCGWASTDHILGPDLRMVETVRRFGNHCCGQLESNNSHLYLDPLSLSKFAADYYQYSLTILLNIIAASVAGDTKCIVHLPSHRSRDLSSPAIFTDYMSTGDKLVVRRRANAQATAHLPDTPDSWVCVALLPALEFHLWRRIDLSKFQMVLVDEEGERSRIPARNNLEQGSPSEPDGLSGASGFIPTPVWAASVLSEAMKNGVDHHRWKPRGYDVEQKFVTLTTDEYRQSIGDEAFLLENDDHGFNFGSRDYPNQGKMSRASLRLARRAARFTRRTARVLWSIVR